MIEATEKDRDLVVTILVSAFKNIKEGNSINLMLKQDSKRIQRMKVLMEFLFDNAIENGKVFLADSKNSCLLITYKYNNRDKLSSLINHVKLVYKCMGYTNLIMAIRRQLIMRKYAPKKDYIKPLIFAAKDGSKGKKSSGRLIIEVLKYYDENRLPVIVDAVTTYNVKLYRKVGFKLIRENSSLGYPIYFLRLN